MNKIPYSPKTNPNWNINKFFCVYSSEKDRYLSEIAIENLPNNLLTHSKYSYEYGWYNKFGESCDEHGITRYYLSVLIQEINIQTSDRIRMIAHELNDNMFYWWFIPCKTDQDGNIIEYYHTGAGKVLAEMI